MNKNTLEHWERRYSDEDDCERWSSDWRLVFYEWAVEHVHERVATFLDVGSGLGYGLQHLCKTHPGWEPTGLDFAASAVSKAVIPTLQLDLLKGDIPGMYDYVLCIQTLEHFSEPDSIVRKLLSAARKQVIITVPYREDISSHREHEFPFSEDYFDRFGQPLFGQRLGRLKVVYGFTKGQRIIHHLRVGSRCILDTVSRRLRIGPGFHADT
jgi:SAM-dependent methyltransferase